MLFSLGAFAFSAYAVVFVIVYLHFILLSILFSTIVQSILKRIVTLFAMSFFPRIFLHLMLLPGISWLIFSPRLLVDNSLVFSCASWAFVIYMFDFF